MTKGRNLQHGMLPFCPITMVEGGGGVDKKYEIGTTIKPRYTFKVFIKFVRITQTKFSNSKLYSKMTPFMSRLA